LPRPAVVQLNMLEPKAGEEIEIIQLWDGKHGSQREWAIRLSNSSEKARAAAELAQDRAGEPGRPESPPEPIRAPTPIRKARQEQPRLFDTGRGTGTDGPMPAARAYAAPHVASRKAPKFTGEPIPANVAFREVTRWVADELRANNLQWSDEAQKNMVCTVFIAEYKAGRIGPWEREK